MARLSAANSTAVIDVPDELVEKYRAAGWVDAKGSKSEAKPARSTAKKDD